MKKIILVGLLLIFINGCVQEDFLDEKCSVDGGSMSISEAIEISEKSDCVKEGSLKGKYICNSVTKTWWIDLEVKDKPLCNPACVVHIDTKQAEINWRCTGAIVD